MPSYHTVGEIARPRGIAPRIISDLFYSHHLDNSRCPVVGGRRIIPDEYVPEIEAVLRERGLLKRETASCK